MSDIRVPQSRSERLIALARFALATGSLISAYVDPVSPQRYPAVAYTLLLLYGIYAAAAAIATAFARGFSPRAQLLSHAADLVFFGVINYMTAAASSPFFVYFIFSIVCAMLRFGRRGTIFTAAAAATVFVISALAGPDQPQFELHRFVIRAIYLAVVAVMLIHFTEYQQRIQRDLARIARWRRSSHADHREFVTELLQEAASIFDAPRVLLGYEAGGRRFAFLCEGERCSAEEDAVAGVLLQSGTSTFVGGATQPSEFSRQLLDQYRMDSVVSTTFHGDFAHGRVVLIDGRPPLLEEVNMARIAATVIGSRLDHFHAAERLQRGAVAEDRMRVGRDLHDSVLQSLAGVSLQLRTLPSLMARDPAEAQKRFDEIGEVLATDQRELRWFIEQLNSAERGGGEVVTDGLLSLALRSRRQWGLDVETDVEPLVHLLPANMRLQIFSLVSEAVANAAKHAVAKHVSVAVAAKQDEIRIRVRDDGRGFPFTGTYDLAALAHMQQGPSTLKARVAELGGDLRIISSSAGAQIDIRLPYETGT